MFINQKILNKKMFVKEVYRKSKKRLTITEEKSKKLTD